MLKENAKTSGMGNPEIKKKKINFLTKCIKNMKNEILNYKSGLIVRIALIFDQSTNHTVQVFSPHRKCPTNDFQSIINKEQYGHHGNNLKPENTLLNQ